MDDTIFAVQFVNTSLIYSDGSVRAVLIITKILPTTQ